MRLTPEAPDIAKPIVDPMLGREDLERNLRAEPVRSVPIIASIALALLLVCNADGLAQWTQRLPSNAATAWAAERADDWRQLMRRLGPARVFEEVKRVLKVD